MALLLLAALGWGKAKQHLQGVQMQLLSPARLAPVATALLAAERRCKSCLNLSPVVPGCRLQTRKEGTAAKQETADEFEVHFAKIVAAVNAALPNYPEWGVRGGPLYSMDNAKFHTSAHLPITAAQRLKIPAGSFDIHKVIEHPFGPIKRTFKSWFTQKRSIRTAQQAMDLLSDIVHRTVNADSIARDVGTMKQTLWNIIQKGGQLADPPYR